MNPLVLGLDVAGGLVAAQQILQRTEINQRRACGDFGRVAVRVAGEKFPAREIHVRFQIRLPRIRHGGFERHHQHPLGRQFLGELIRGEGFAETHLGVPEKTRRGLVLLVRPDGIEIVERLFDRRHLLPPHSKSLMVRAGEGLAGA